MGPRILHWSLCTSFFSYLCMGTIFFLFLWYRTWQDNLSLRNIWNFLYYYFDTKLKTSIYLYGNYIKVLKTFPYYVELLLIINENVTQAMIVLYYKTFDLHLWKVTNNRKKHEIKYDVCCLSYLNYFKKFMYKNIFCFK